MPQIINTNMASLNAQRNLNSSQSALATSLQRLSSGLRINSAKDDAAGLAISDRFTTQIRGMNQAIRNANDGISLSQTGEGALAEVSANLQRIRELAVQAANATNSDSDRAALDLEVQQRLAEIDRISAQTNFNGRKMLDGSFGNATFQVGADAGQVIRLDLEGSTRIDDIGRIARAESIGLGTDMIEGHIDVTPTEVNFGEAGSAATAGSISFTATTFNFTDATLQVDGTSDAFTIDTAAVGGLNFSTPGGVATPATYTTATTNLADMAYLTDGDGANAHFFFSDDTVSGMELTLDWGDHTTDIAAGLMAADLQNQLAAAGSNTQVDWVVDNPGVSGHLVFTSGETGTAATTPNIDSAGPALVDAAANTWDVTGTPAAGVDEVATTNAVITVDGGDGPVAITLDQDAGGDLTTLASQLTTKLQTSGLVDAANYSASVVNGTQIQITHNGDLDAVAITAADSVATAAGFAVSTGEAGAAATAGNPASLTIDGTLVDLTMDYGSYSNLAAAIESQLGPADFSVSGDDATGEILIERTTTGASSTSVDITLADANAQAGLGLSGPSVSGTAGADAVARTNATFYVDGNVVNLTTDFVDLNASGSAYDELADDISGQLAGYTASYDDGTGLLTISKDGSIDAVSITGADTNATAAGFGFASGVEGVADGGVSFTDDLFIEIGGDQVNFGNTTYDSTSDLAEAINRELSGIAADIVDGKLRLSSTSDFEVSGDAATAINIAGAYTSDNGALESVNVIDVSAANDAIVRVDAALTEVSNLRSTFGAIQNRFESTISNLTTTAENMTASRSRIMDADFAQETAALTRAQILQQAGTAMLAQANQIPQNVLSLLG